MNFNLFADWLIRVEAGGQVDDKEGHGYAEVGRTKNRSGARNKTRIYHWLAGSHA